MRRIVPVRNRSTDFAGPKSVARIRARGFSLVEVLVAIALLILLAAAMSAFTWRLVERRARLTAEADRQRDVGALFTHIETDLLTSVAGDGGQAGISGDGAGLKLLTRGVGLVAGDAGPDVGDLQGCEYRFAGGRVTGKRWKGAKADAALGEDVIVAGVGRVRFRYFDERAWHESFDSVKAGRLPAAVEVAVWFDAPPALTRTEDPAPSPAGGGSGDEGAEAAQEEAWPSADRVRVIVVPDGPDAWSGG